MIKGNSAKADIRDGEVALERTVSEVIGRMSFKWLPIGDEPGTEQPSAAILNATRLLS